jgi:hypothetical protein
MKIPEFFWLQQQILLYSYKLELYGIIRSCKYILLPPCQFNLEVTAMAKSILLPLQQLHFPSRCVVCLSTAPKKYPIQQVFTYGRRSHTIHVDVPMCDAHFAEASFKSLAERAVGCLGVGIGILAGLAAGILLFLRWVGSGGLLLKLFMGTLAAFGIFIIVWWLLAIVIAPYFAARGSKEVRNAVRITRYLHSEQLVEIAFVNEQMALLVEASNT